MVNKKYQNPSIAISYDSRIKSDVFAKASAEVFAANGIKVYIYKELMPVPMLSFATRYLKCSAGIAVTASHNPKQYNGYKVYGNDGCQMTTESANAVLHEILELDIFNDVKFSPLTSFKSLSSKSLFAKPGFNIIKHISNLFVIKKLLLTFNFINLFMFLKRVYIDY